MRMTSRKKEILSYYEPDSLEWVIGEIGAPPFDVSGIAYLIHGMESLDKRHQLESTRRTLENMVAGGLLEKVTVYEQRQNIPRVVPMRRGYGVTWLATDCRVSAEYIGIPGIPVSGRL